MYNLITTIDSHKIFENRNIDYSVTEVDYPSPLQRVLQQHLPLLRTIGQQPRWQLWLSSQPILTRSWIEESELSINKVIQLPNIKQENMVTIVEKALLSGNFSYILVCFSDISPSDKERLNIAAKKGYSHLFIVNEINQLFFPATIYH